ncbi:hypothetical protein ACETRX_35085 [Labrys portucalensis]|uniref:Transposase family protein n=1 Tax=Labrys neptuniae TaxID=376174 RepID=A0ABV6ZRP8_9HYPH
MFRQEAGYRSRETGEVRYAELFVAVLGVSSYIFAEASGTQALADWIGNHVRLFRFFGDVPRPVTCDNLKSDVNEASFYELELNRSYGVMASHYGVGVLPARPHIRLLSGKDKRNGGWFPPSFRVESAILERGARKIPLSPHFCSVNRFSPACRAPTRSG